MFNRKNFLKYMALFLLGQFLWVQCNSPIESNNNEAGVENELQNIGHSSFVAIQPGFDNIDVPFGRHPISCQEAQTISIEKTGTRIEIPANAFVDANGNAIEGEVEILFREFHDAADIIASGIPMHNPETGEYMETAGMFEIKGQQKGQAIFIRPGKKIEVNLASYNAGDDFDFFALDPKKGSWITKSENVPAKINLHKQQEMSKLINQTPKAPIGPARQGDSGQYIVDIDVNYKEFPELSVFKNVVWVYAGAQSDSDNPQRSEWVFQTDWTYIELKRNEKEEGSYILELKEGNKIFKTRVKPIIGGADNEKAMANFERDLATYQESKKEMEERLNMLRQQADLSRSYAVEGFGIYNWDIWKEPGRKQMHAKVELKPEHQALVEQELVTLFLVSENRRAVVRYKYSDLKNFSLPTADNNVLIAVLPGNKVAYYDAKSFQNLLQQKTTDKVNLKLKYSNKTIESVEDIRNLIGDLT